MNTICARASISYAIALASFAGATPSSAALLRIESIGVVEEIQFFTPQKPVSKNTIKIGDTFNFTQIIDTETYRQSPSYNTNLSHYYGGIAAISLSVGQYSYVSGRTAETFVDFANDYGGQYGYDAQHFGIRRIITPDESPFDFGGLNVELFAVASFMSDITARNSTFISEINDPLRYSNRRFEYVLTGQGGASSMQAGIYGKLTTTIISAIPEASTWVMMLVGFAMVAGVARYRRRATKVAYA